MSDFNEADGVYDSEDDETFDSSEEHHGARQFVNRRGSTQNGWNEWSRFVLAELKRVNRNIEFVKDRQDKIRTDIAVLQLKAAMAGVIAGLIVTIIANYLRAKF